MMFIDFPAEQICTAVGVVMAVLGVLTFVVMLRSGKPAPVTEWEHPKVNTRKEDLQRWLRGEIDLQEYLDLHSGHELDGSLTRERRREKPVSEWTEHDFFECLQGRIPWQSLEQRVFDEVYKTAEKEIPINVKLFGATYPIGHSLDTNVYTECKAGSHPGQRISRKRLRKGLNPFLPDDWLWEVWQPSLNDWMPVERLGWDDHSCCPQYIWVRTVNGKKIG